MLPSAFLREVSKNVSSHFVKLLQCRLEASILSFPLQASNISPLTLSLQSSVQDWGEEVEEGAIYNVTLKRVQIQQAANKGARWLGVSRPTSDVSQCDRSTADEAFDSQRNRLHK